MDKQYDAYYSADLYISIVNIEANSKEQAESIVQEFIDKIAPIMNDQVRWHEVDWKIEENVYNPETDEWEAE